MRKICLFVFFLLLTFSLTTAYGFDQNGSNSITSNVANQIKSLSVSKTNVTIDCSGKSEFVDVIATNSDGSTTNVNEIADWSSSNPSVAIGTGLQGRILAVSNGKTVISVSYKGITKNISVNVLKNLDKQQLMSQAKTLELAQTPLNTTQAVASSSTLTTLERQAIEDKATKMNMSVVWTAAKLLVGWRGNTTYFPAGARICGIPYSQTVNWCDDIQFNAALNYSDFYDSYSRDSIVMPKYGLDCSGFVSKAWGEGRQTTLDFVNQIKSGARPKVGIYDPNNLTQANLLNSYKSLQQGDAVVYRSGSDGHAFEISFNDGTGVYCNEETVPQTAYSYWTYAQLAANSYMPFSKK